jgi:hypothetical protein
MTSVELNKNIMDIGIGTIRMIVRCSGNNEIMDEVMKGNWKKINHVRDIIRNVITPMEEMGNSEYESIVFSYVCMIKAALGILPREIDDIQNIFMTLAPNLTDEQNNALTNILVMSFVGTDDYIPAIDDTYDEIKDSLDPIGRECIDECIRIIKHDIIDREDQGPMSINEEDLSEVTSEEEEEVDLSEEEVDLSEEEEEGRSV